MKKYKIIANKEQLKGIGIDYDLAGLECEIIGSYNLGYKRVSVVHKVNGIDFSNDFSIPSWYLEKIT